MCLPSAARSKVQCTPVFETGAGDQTRGVPGAKMEPFAAQLTRVVKILMRLGNSIEASRRVALDNEFG